jgi:hypothetical protein
MVRVYLIVAADMPVPRMIAGIMNIPRLPNGSSTKGIYSMDGVQFHQTEGHTITRVASQKLGRASPIMAKLRAT